MSLNEQEEIKNIWEGTIVKIANFISLICEKICIFLIIIMLFTMWSQTILRYLNIGLPWAEEVCRYIMVWLGMIGASILVIEEDHIKLTFLVEKFNKKAGVILKIIFHLLTFWMVFYFVKYGLIYAQTGFRTMCPSLPITRFWPNLAIPIGGILMLFNLIILMWRDIKIVFMLNGPTRG